MTISKKDQKLLLCAGGLLLALLAYLFVFRNFSEKNSDLQKENQNLSSQVQQLEILDANKEQYISDTKDLKAQVQEMIDRYPSEVREENAVMYAYEMENESDIHVNSMTITPANLLYTMEKGYGLSVITVNMDYSVTYEGFKDIIDFIRTDRDKRNVESISLSYDSETGNLLGTMVVNLFELQGIDKEYEAPYIPSMPRGNTNPFGTTGVSQENQEEAAQNEEQNED